MVRPIWFKLTFVLLVLLPIGFWAGVESCKSGRVFNDSHLAHALSKVVNLNQIKLAVGEGIDLAKVRVDWGGDGPPGQSPQLY
ncbi:MAG: hypothetical protein H6510_04020 [Acidobacteria bacterium]|nr:hypothetical protein [Acidobacteriota bacterium]MCB9396962.1 hypothetical protein [Acidobacteriota bacterium]